MKPRVRLRVQFGKSARPTPARATERVPRVARLLALAHALAERIRRGDVVDLAAASRQEGLSRARLSQVTNLILLVPGIQGEILDLPPVTTGRDAVTERNLREIAAEAVWERQLALWSESSQACKGEPERERCSS